MTSPLFPVFSSRADGRPVAGDSQPIYFYFGPNLASIFDLRANYFTNSKFIEGYGVSIRFSIAGPLKFLINYAAKAF